MLYNLLIHLHQLVNASLLNVCLQQGDINLLLNFQVRIFTYLIGREAAFADNLKWMACANKG